MTSLDNLDKNVLNISYLCLIYILLFAYCIQRYILDATEKLV